MNIKSFCHCSLFPSWSGKELISTPVGYRLYPLFGVLSSTMYDSCTEALDVKRFHNQSNNWWCDRKEHYWKLNVWFLVVTVLTMRSASGRVGCHVIWCKFTNFLQNISKFLTNYHAITCPGTVIFTKVQSSKVQNMRRTHSFCWRHSV